MNEALVRVIRPDQARVNVTYAGGNGELPDPVSVDATDGDIKTMLTEALRAGSIPGIQPVGDVDLRDFVVDRFAPAEGRDYNLIMLRPKTPFGIASYVPATPLGPHYNTGDRRRSMGHGCPTCGRAY